MNGYITIQINGKPVGLKFAYPAIKWFYAACTDNNIVFFVGDDFSTEGFAKLIQCGYKNNCLIKEIKPALTYENFLTYVDQQKQTEEGLLFLADIFKVYAESKDVKEHYENEKKRLAEMEMMIEKLNSIESKQ